MHTCTYVPRNLKTQSKDIVSGLAWVTGGSHNLKENKNMSATQESFLEHRLELALVLPNIVNYHDSMKEIKISCSDWKDYMKICILKAQN